MAKEKKRVLKQPAKKKSSKETNELKLDLPPNEVPMEITNIEEKETVSVEIKKDLRMLSSSDDYKENVIQELSVLATTIKGTNFSFTKTVFFQVHIGNIYNIFGAGIITPAKYIANRAFSDPQTISPSSLVFSNGFLSEKADSIALLEINIKKEEVHEYLVQDEVAFISKPLPISRIKKIHVSNDKIKKDIVTTTLLNDGGIIPEKLISPYFPTNINVVKHSKPRTEQESVDYSLKIKKYNSVLGSLAFLKNYSILLANKSESIAALPDHFFFAAQALNNSTPLQIVKNDKIVSFYSQLYTSKNGIESPLLKWLFDRINENRNFNDDDVNEFSNFLFQNSQVKEPDFLRDAKEILQGLKRSLDRKNAIKKIAQMRDADKFYLYLFALLRTYGNANSEDKSISRADMPMFVANTYGEYVFALLGYFYGYNTLRNYDDKITINDSVFLNNIDVPKRFPIKFELNTLFDYAIIESVYSNVFISNSNVVDTSFIASESIKKEWIRKPNNLPNDYLFKGDEVFGKFIYHYKKKSPPNESLEILNKLPLEIPVISDLGVFCFRNGLPRHYINLGDLLLNKTRLQFVIYFKKEEIAEAVKSNKINVKELLQRIENSILYNEL